MGPFSSHDTCLLTMQASGIGLIGIVSDFYVPCSARVKPLDTHTLVFGRAVNACVHSHFISLYTCIFKHVPCSVVPADIGNVEQCTLIHSSFVIHTYCTEYQGLQ